MTKLVSGDVAPTFVAETLHGAAVTVPARKLIHLQFRRLSGCTMWNLMSRSIAKRIDEIRAAGIHELVLVHSNVETIALAKPPSIGTVDISLEGRQDR